MTPTSESHASAAATRGTPTTGHRRGAHHAGHTSGTLHRAVTPASVDAKGTKVPRKCPLCSSKDWASEREADFQRAPSRESEVDAVLEGLILGEYRKGRSCVDISISEGIPYSLVFETVKRNSTTANNIKV